MIKEDESSTDYLPGVITYAALSIGIIIDASIAYNDETIANS